VLKVKIVGEGGRGLNGEGFNRSWPHRDVFLSASYAAENSSTGPAHVHERNLLRSSVQMMVVSIRDFVHIPMQGHESTWHGASLNRWHHCPACCGSSRPRVANSLCARVCERHGSHPVGVKGQESLASICFMLLLLSTFVCYITSHS
jgi:hypothetical protein